MNLSHNEQVTRSAPRWAWEIIDNAACRLADPDLALACRAMRLACSRADDAPISPDELASDDILDACGNCGQHLKDGSGTCIDCGQPIES